MRALGAVVAVLLLAGVAAAPASAGGTGGGGVPHAGASIVKGKTAPMDQFPWLAHIDYVGVIDAYECSGTVVAPRLVLTAGHCAVSTAGHLLAPENFRVVTGVADLKQAGPGNVSQVVQTLVAPGFSLEKLRSDAALLVLSAPVSAPAIPLAGPGDAGLYGAGTQISIAGWGLTDGRATKTPTVLRQAGTVIQSADFCGRKLERSPFRYSAATQLCAIGAPKFEVSSCHGDSGGPGIGHRADGTPVQVGVISFGLVGDCNPRRPEVQTRVDGVSQWVGQWIGAIEQGAPAPEAFIPPLLRLPRLRIADAKFLSWEVLAYDFGQRFLQGRYKEVGCRPVDREKVKCRVFWYHARTVYSGAVTTYLSLPQEGSLVNFRYRIRAFDAVCWAYSRNPSGCPRTLFYR